MQPFTLDTPWTGAATRVALTAVYELSGDSVRGFVTDATISAVDSFDGAADQCRAAIIDFSAPMRLTTVAVAKPWGREIWYTGVEARGVALVTDGRHASPLPWALALAPRHLQGDAPLTLLKVLDPSPRPTTGDLYFELHEHKREVYVVTHIDPIAWPTGVGAIRFGMNQDVRKGYADDERFKRDYLRAVTDYQSVRRAIDAGEDDPGLHTHEVELRQAMEAFTALRTLRAGDVVQVPPHVPHSLQHGVRVIEFQTPVYERKIISFTQRVMTQPHWDSDEAVSIMSLDAPPEPQFEQLHPADDGIHIERVASFSDFSVQRIRLREGAAITIPSNQHHCLAICVSGSIEANGIALAPEQAALLPASLAAPRLYNTGRTLAMMLIAGPAR